MIRIILSLFLFFSLTCTLSAAEAYRGTLPTNRYEVASLVSNLLRLNGQAPTPAVVRRMDLSNVPADKIADVGTVVHLGLLQLIDGEFYGDKMVTRYQMAMIVSQLLSKLGVPRLPIDSPPHPIDVSVEFRRRDNVLRVLSLGYMDLEENEFRGNYPTSRYALAAIGARFAERLSMKAQAFEMKFKDVPGSSPYRRAIQICYAVGLMTLPGQKKVVSVGKSKITSKSALPPVSEERKKNNTVIRDLHKDVKDLVSRHAILKTKLVNIANRFELGEPSAPRFLEPLDEEWIAINLRLIEILSNFNNWLAQGREALSPTQRRAVKKVHSIALQLAQQMQEARWRLRTFFKMRREGKKTKRRPNLFRKDDSKYDIISPGY